MTDPYAQFLAAKSRDHIPAGFDADVDPEGLFPFQRAAVTWALRTGRAALFEETGLGKTRQQLVWAHHVVEHTGRPVLVLAPLAVAPQTEREARRVGVPDVRVVRDADNVRPGINITNYERLHRFDASVFSGVVLDESSILKNYTGSTRRALTEAFAATPYRLACTATPAPNDHLELGNHAEFLGVMSSHQMIARWFLNDSKQAGNYRLKGHAVRPYWDWVTSWARCVGRPSDLGPYSDEGYDLPELRVHRHSVGVDQTEGRGDGELFRAATLTATSLHAERRRTAEARARAVADLVTAEPGEPWLVWVDTNYDADAVMALLPHAVEVRGDLDADEKAARLLRFSDEGGVLVTKAGIAGMGLNWQHCARMVFNGLSFSYEAYYQAVRRCWRFGQTRPVDVHAVLASTEQAVWGVLDRKADDHDEMKVAMFAASRRAAARAVRPDDYHPSRRAPVPAWLTEAA